MNNSFVKIIGGVVVDGPTDLPRSAKLSDGRTVTGITPSNIHNFPELGWYEYVEPTVDHTPDQDVVYDNSTYVIDNANKTVSPGSYKLVPKASPRSISIQDPNDGYADEADRLFAIAKPETSEEI